MRGALIVAAAAICGACSGAPRVVEVKVPVEVSRRPPAELVGCTAGLPVPVFEAAAGGALLPNKQIPVLQSLIDSLYRCDSGWRAWAKQ